MTKHHMNRAAELVKAILNGEWTNEPPPWVDTTRYDASDWFFDDASEHNGRYTRAAQTAEAFIMLLSASDPQFDVQRFLVACGLAETTKKGRTR